MEISASGAATSESSSSLCARPSFQPCAEMGWMPRKNRGVGPPSASRPGQLPTLAPFSPHVLVIRSPEVSSHSTKLVSDEVSLVRIRVMRFSRACANSAPLKDQPIGPRQASHRMAKTNALAPLQLPHKFSLRHLEARSVKMQFNQQANFLEIWIPVCITHYTV
jgi:hypothetical protein